MCFQALANRYKDNQESQGHGWIHQDLVMARLKSSEGVTDRLIKLLENELLYDSLMTDHNTDRNSNNYCTDSIFSYVGMINEALLYSNTGIIEALSAVPADYESGKITGLRARANAQVDIEWNTETVTLTVTSDEAQTINVSLYGGETQTVEFKENETKTFTFER